MLHLRAIHHLIDTIAVFDRQTWTSKAKLWRSTVAVMIVIFISGVSTFVDILEMSIKNETNII